MVIKLSYTLAITTNILPEMIQAWKDYDVRILEITGNGKGASGEGVSIANNNIGTIFERTRREAVIRFSTEGYNNALTFDAIRNWMFKNRIASVTASKLKMIMPFGEQNPEMIEIGFESFTAHTKLFRKMTKGEDGLPNQELLALLNEIKKEIKSKVIRKRWRPSIMMMTEISPRRYAESYESLYQIKLPRMSIFDMKTRELNLQEIGMKRKGG